MKCSWQNAASTSTTSKSETLSARDEWIGSLGKGLFRFAAAEAAMFSVSCDSPALAESLTVAFPVSRAPEVIVLLILNFVIFFAHLILEVCCLV